MGIAGSKFAIYIQSLIIFSSPGRVYPNANYRIKQTFLLWNEAARFHLLTHACFVHVLVNSGKCWSPTVVYNDLLRNGMTFKTPEGI